MLFRSVLDDPTTTDEEEFTVKDSNNGGGNGIGGVGSGNNPGGDGGVNFDNVGELLKQWWQVIASVVSIILIIIFLSKTIGYESRRREANKTVKDKYNTFYAGATGLFGLAMTAWTAIACVLMGLAAASFVIMIIAKSRCQKAERELADRKDEYTKMMFMRMMGGQGGGNMGGGYVVQQGLGADEIRGIVSETMTAMLPGMQQMLPQQASSNDEVIKSLIEGQKAIMEKLAEQPAERIVEREVASAGMVGVVGVANANDDETIKKLVEGQDLIMQCLAQLTKEKVVESNEKIVEKIVEVPVEVEKIVEKEVVKEVPVEKVVEKEVKVSAPAKPKKEKTPRLTLDEAYAKLTKTQQKYFDSLRDYALSKDKCKEKKSTYFILLGQSSVNPLVKLTIKKDTTVALFKMEDEYLKDIKRDATGDGTKIKVKETEVIISDAQACKAAKNMIDLREDQIERYQDLLREQRAMNKK